MDALIRPAAERDIPAITAITNDAIVSSAVHFAITPDEVGAVRDRFRAARGVYPWFVAECDGRVLGFARASEWKPREAYGWTCESAVYVAEGVRGRGLGLGLYRALFDELRERGFRCVLAGVAVPNAGSERLHERIGMSVVGEFPAVGYKMERWVSVRYYAMVFGDGSAPGPIGCGMV